MSTPTNFNQPSTPNFGSNNSGGNKNTTTIMGVSIAALLALCGYLFVSKNSTANQLEQTTTELTQQNTALAELEGQYAAAKAELEQSKGINAELDAKINEQVSQLEAQKNEIAGLIRAKKDYKNQIAALTKQKDEFLVQIEDLKRQNGILTEQNTTLTNQNTELTTNLTETSSQLEQQKSSNASLISEKTNLEAERTVLSKKVDIASAVRVKNINVKSVDVRKSGKEKSKSRAGKVDKLNICFTTEANEVVPAGEETFYLRIIDPTGSPLAIESLGSGVAQSKRDEQEFRYTTTATCNYSNGESEVCGYWQPGQDFVKGQYKVEVYNKGYLVGTGAFKLK